MLVLIFKEPNCCFSYTSFLLIIFNIIHQFIDQTNVFSSRQILKKTKTTFAAAFKDISTSEC